MNRALLIQVRGQILDHPETWSPEAPASVLRGRQTYSTAGWTVILAHHPHVPFFLYDPPKHAEPEPSKFPHAVARNQPADMVETHRGVAHQYVLAGHEPESVNDAAMAVLGISQEQADRLFDVHQTWHDTGFALTELIELAAHENA